MKSDVAITLLNKGDLVGAFKIFKTFRLGFTDQERRSIEIAYDHLVGNVRLYGQIGIDTKEEFKKSMGILMRKYPQINQSKL